MRNSEPDSPATAGRESTGRDAARQHAARQHASMPRTSDRAALWFALIVALIVGIASTAIGLEIYAGRRAEVVAASRAVVRSVGAAVAQTVERAVGYGIPIDRLYRADAYLAQSMRASGEISAIILQDTGGRVVAGAGAASQVEPVVVPVTVAGSDRGRLLLFPAYTIARQTRTTIVQMAIVVTVLAGLAAGILMRALLAETIDLRRARFAAAARRVARGYFGENTPPLWDSPMSALNVAAGTHLAAVRSEARAVAALADEIRAVDFDGTLAPRVARAIAPLGPLPAFQASVRQRFNTLWAGWWALAVLALAGATRPLLASFAADRIDAGLFQAVQVAGSVALGAAGQLAGLLAALLVLRARPLAIALALALVAGALVWVSDSRGFSPVLIARLLIGFGTGFAVWSLIALDGRFLRQPFRWALMLLAAEGAGPILGVLCDQMIGRRLTLEIAGVLAGVLAILALALRTRSTARLRLALPPHALRPLAALTLSTAAAVAFMDGALSGGPVRDDLARVALGYALFGGGLAVLPLIRPGRRATAGLAALALLAAAALSAWFPAGPLPLAPLPAGLALGAVATLAGGLTFTAAGGVALAGGALTGALALAGAALLGTSPAWALWPPAAAALAILLAGAPRRSAAGGEA